MCSIKIYRLEKKHGCTIGTLTLDDAILCHTLELPWADNRRDVSCIPAGTYDGRRVQSPRFGPTIQICDVPGRSHILFHAGNTVSDTQGCILTGRRVGWLHGRRAVLDSRSSFLELLRELDGRDVISVSILEAGYVA